MGKFGKGIIVTIVLIIASFAKQLFIGLIIALMALGVFILHGLVALVFLILIIANIFCLGWLVELLAGKKKKEEGE